MRMTALPRSLLGSRLSSKKTTPEATLGKGYEVLVDEHPVGPDASYTALPAPPPELGVHLRHHRAQGGRGETAGLLKQAGLPEIRFHDLRHTCATLLLSKNVNPKVVSEMLGHASIAITLDTYSHVLPTMQESAAKAMEDALS